MTNEVDTLLDTAFNHYNAGDFETAEEFARRVLSIKPSHGDGLYLLGLIAFQSGALEPASELLYQAVKLYPNTDNYVLALASVLQRLGRLDEALSFYEKHKDNPVVLAQMGFIYASKGQTEWAMSAFNKALAQDKMTAEAILGLAILAQQQGDLKKAETLLSDATAHLNSPELFYRLAVVYRLQGENDKALIQIDKALNLMNNHVYLNEKGLVLENLGQDDEALMVYRQAVDMNAYYPDPLAGQGNIYMRCHQYDLAEDAYKKALALDNKFFMAHHNLASLLYKQDRKNEALDHYQEAVIIDPKNMTAVYNLAVIQEDIGEFSEAAGLYFNALVGGLKNDTLEFRIASVLEQLFKSSKEGKKQALDFTKGWVKHFPDSVVAWHTLSALTGKKSSDAKGLMERYAQKLYDVFAIEYDEKMKKLKAISIDEAEQILKNKKFKKVLDLGCGTGSFGKKLKQNFNSLIGVDLSQKMLDIAQTTNSYDKLICASVTDYLENTKSSFDLIVMLELTGYLDDLSPVLNGIKSHLNQKGMFIFSVEYPSNNMASGLSSNGRYVYSKSDVITMLEKANLTLIDIKEINLRREDDGYAKGALVTGTL